MGPSKLAIIHCPGHQKGDGPIQKENSLAVQTAREVAITSTLARLGGPRTPGFTGRTKIHPGRSDMDENLPYDTMPWRIVEIG